MSEKIEQPHKLHVFEWVADYIDKNNRQKMLYQFDKDSEYYSEKDQIIPFVPVVMNILNKEKRLKSFHLIPRGQTLNPQTFPRYTVDLTDGSYHVNGQMFKFLPKKVSLNNFRLIYFFSPVKITGVKEDGTSDGIVIGEYIRLYKLGLQANDQEGNNYQKIMIWNAEDEALTIQDEKDIE